MRNANMVKKALPNNGSPNFYDERQLVRQIFIGTSTHKSKIALFLLLFTIP